MRTPKWLPFACLSAWLLIVGNFAAPALAADAEKGKLIAQSRCSPCQGSAAARTATASAAPALLRIKTSVFVLQTRPVWWAKTAEIPQGL